MTDKLRLELTKEVYEERVAYWARMIEEKGHISSGVFQVYSDMKVRWEKRVKEIEKEIKKYTE